MKKLLVLVIFIVGVSFAYATPYTGGAHESGPAILTTCVISPLTITPAQFSAQLPVVIKGDVRVLPNNSHYHVWKVTKENLYSVKFDVKFAENPIYGVALKGHWTFTPETFLLDGVIYPENPVPPAYTLQNSGVWNWDGGIFGPTMYCVLYVDKIDASAATAPLPGPISFVATIDAYYDNL